MKKLLVLLIACLALGLTFAACGDDDDDDGGGSASTTTTEQTDTGAAPPGGGGGTETVDMKDIQYVPKDVTVDAGTTITWTNSDPVPHTVTKDSGPGADFDSGNVDPGGTYKQTFDEPGKVDYLCTIHPGQTGTVTVE